MKFVKGMFWGGIVSAGIWMIYNETMNNNNRMMKKGKQFAKKLGMM